MGNGNAQGGYIIEFLVVGKSVKVTAIDPETLTEVCIIGSPLMPRRFLAKQAVRKLEYMLAKGQA